MINSFKALSTRGLSSVLYTNSCKASNNVLTSSLVNFPKCRRFLSLFLRMFSKRCCSLISAFSLFITSSVFGKVNSMLSIINSFIIYINNTNNNKEKK